MKAKKQIYLFFILSTLLISFLPLLNLWFSYNKHQKITQKMLFSTDNLESIVNYGVYRLLHLSLRPNEVIAGKDRFLFLGDGFGGVVHKSQGEYLPSDMQVEQWLEKIKKLQQWYLQQGIPFVLVIAPNKHTIYADKLPNNITYREGGTLTDKIMQQSAQKNLPIVNLKYALLAHKKEQQLYLYTDTHWNAYGAYLGYLETIKALHRFYHQAITVPACKLSRYTYRKPGDLTRLLKIKRFMSDNTEVNFHTDCSPKSKLCYGTISKENHLQPCTPGIKNKFNRYSINPAAPNSQTLLYICDSFGLENSIFYEKTFHTVWRLHTQYMHSKILPLFIRQNKPDLVIYQIVERDLANNTIIDDLPVSTQ